MSHWCWPYQFSVEVSEKVHADTSDLTVRPWNIIWNIDVILALFSIYFGSSASHFLISSLPARSTPLRQSPTHVRISCSSLGLFFSLSLSLSCSHGTSRRAMGCSDRRNMVAFCVDDVTILFVVARLTMTSRAPEEVSRESQFIHSSGFFLYGRSPIYNNSSLSKSSQERDGRGGGDTQREQLALTSYDSS